MVSAKTDKTISVEPPTFEANTAKTIVFEMSPQNTARKPGTNDEFVPNWDLNFDENIFEIYERWYSVKEAHAQL